MRPTQGDILAMIDQLGKEAPKRPTGSGWFTVAQMAKRKGLNISAMRFRMKLAMTKGMKVERFVGSDYDGTGALVKQTFFRVKP